MSRALWPGRGSARGGPTFSSAPTAAAVPSVNLGPPVGLPPDVLQHILTFVDGRGLAVCEQVCKGMRSTASDKQLYVGGTMGACPFADEAACLALFAAPRTPFHGDDSSVRITNSLCLLFA